MSRSTWLSLGLLGLGVAAVLVLYGRTDDRARMGEVPVEVSSDVEVVPDALVGEVPASSPGLVGHPDAQRRGRRRRARQPTKTANWSDV